MAKSTYLPVDRAAADDPQLDQLIAEWGQRHGPLSASPLRTLERRQDGRVVTFPKEKVDLVFSDGTTARLERSNSSPEWTVMQDPDARRMSPPQVTAEQTPKSEPPQYGLAKREA
jgi:hypothetical protein